jgi:hypothetical protein
MNKKTLKQLTKIPIVYPKDKEKEVLINLRSAKRITLQFRCYANNSRYDKSKKVATVSWHFRGIDSVKEVEAILENALKNQKGLVITRNIMK